jgi:hypothetical protein
VTTERKSTTTSPNPAAVLVGGPSVPPATEAGPRVVRILYTNWKGQVSWRRILPTGLMFGSTEWHPAEQWLLEAVDLDKDAPRTFAIKDIVRWEVSSSA